MTLAFLDAAMEDRVDLVRPILQDQDSIRWEALTWAAAHGSLGVVRTLVESTCQRSRNSDMYDAALVQAVERKHPAVVRYLLTGTDVDEESYGGRYTRLPDPEMLASLRTFLRQDGKRRADEEDFMSRLACGAYPM